MRLNRKVLCLRFLQSIRTARRAQFDLTKASYYPTIIGNTSDERGATSWIHLQYLQLNKHFVSSSVLHACEFQITQRLKRTLNINWHKADHMEGRSEWFLGERLGFTSTLPTSDIGCEASNQAWNTIRRWRVFELLPTCLNICRLLTESEMRWTQAAGLTHVIPQGLMPLAPLRYRWGVLVLRGSLPMGGIWSKRGERNKHLSL